MMDQETFETFRRHRVAGAESGVTLLPHLTPEERGLFDRIVSQGGHNRLEQEKIPHQYVAKRIQQMLSRE